MTGDFEQTFFTLLRCGIWDTTPILSHSPSKKEWTEIYNISKEQTVSGIMLDAIAKLPEEQKPPIELRLQWIALQKNIEKQNIAMNNVLIEIFEELRKNGIEPYLLKGQGIAQNYKFPLHRASGDIDLYFKNERDFENAFSFFIRNGCNMEDDSEDTHAETTYKNIKIELHKKCFAFYTKKIQKKASIILADTNGEKSSVTIHNMKVRTLPPIANALQLIAHMLKHIILSGIGMRQICDWVLFINKHHNSIDKELFLKQLEELELTGTYKAITAIATVYLDMPKEFILCEINDKDVKNAKRVLNLVMKYGNFGQYGEHAILTSKLHYIKIYLWKVRNCIRFHSMAKSETWNYPIWQLHSIKDFLKRKEMTPDQDF